MDANPEAYAHASAKYTRPGVDAFVRDLIETYVERCDAVVFLQTIEHVKEPEGRCSLSSRRCPTRSMSRRPTCSRSRRPAPPSRTIPGTCASTARRSSARSARACSIAWSWSASFTRASCGRTSWRCGQGWDELHGRLGITKTFYDRFTPAISARDFALRTGPLEDALDFVAVLR